MLKKLITFLRRRVHAQLDHIPPFYTPEWRDATGWQLFGWAVRLARSLPWALCCVVVYPFTTADDWQ